MQTFTGGATAPTRSPGDSTTNVATTAFVQAAVGSALFANPTALVGLTAVNGSATTAMRSDAAPAINQAITPTWTGLHTFGAGIACNITTSPLGQCFNFSQNSPGGTYSGPTNLNLAALGESLTGGASLMNGYSFIEAAFGGNGGRNAFAVTMFTAGWQGTGGNEFNTALIASNIVSANAGGTSAILHAGAVFAFNPQVVANSASTYYTSMIVDEHDLSFAGSSGTAPLFMAALTLVQGATHAAHAQTMEGALVFTNQPGALGWNNLILAGNWAPGSASPFAAANACLMCLVNNPGFKYGINLQNANPVSGDLAGFPFSSGVQGTNGGISFSIDWFGTVTSSTILGSGTNFGGVSHFLAMYGSTNLTTSSSIFLGDAAAGATALVQATTFIVRNLATNVIFADYNSVTPSAWSFHGTGGVTIDTAAGVMLDVTSVNTGGVNAVYVQNGGTLSNSATNAEFAAILSAGSGTYIQMYAAGGASPNGNFGTGPGLTGGLNIFSSAGAITIVPATSLNITQNTAGQQLLNISQVAAGGSVAGPINMNQLAVQEGLTVSGSGGLSAWSFLHVVTGGTNNRNSLIGQVTLTGDLATVGADVVAGFFNAVGNVATTHSVHLFAMNPQATLLSGATGYAEVTGAEVNMGISTGATASYMSGITIAIASLHAVPASSVGAMLVLTSISAPSAVDFGIAFGNWNAATTNPIKSTGSLFVTFSGVNVARGIDLSNSTFSNAAFKSPGFTVDGSGNVIAAAIFGTLTSATGTNAVCNTPGTTTQLTVQVWATGCVASSARFKEGIESISRQQALTDVLGFDAVRYRYRSGEHADGGVLHVGFTAEQVGSIDPQWITYEDDGVTPHAVKYQEMVPLLAAAIQQLKADNDNLRAEIEALKTGTHR